MDCAIKRGRSEEGREGMYLTQHFCPQSGFCINPFPPGEFLLPILLPSKNGLKESRIRPETLVFKTSVSPWR